MSNDDDLAAEYVLGLADDPTLERRIATDSDFAARVDEWQSRLSAMDDEFPETAAPPLLPAIEARLFGRKPRRWYWTALGGLVAASLAAFLFFAPADDMVMTMASADRSLVVQAAYSPSDRMLRLERMKGPAAPTGFSYEGWVILPGQAPVSVGLLGDGMMEAPMELPTGTVIAVSLEPEGGSTTGQPTGPVILSTTIEI